MQWMTLRKYPTQSTFYFPWKRQLNLSIDPFECKIHIPVYNVYLYLFIYTFFQDDIIDISKNPTKYGIINDDDDVTDDDDVGQYDDDLLDLLGLLMQEKHVVCGDVFSK